MANKVSVELVFSILFRQFKWKFIQQVHFKYHFCQDVYKNGQDKIHEKPQASPLKSSHESHSLYTGLCCSVFCARYFL